MDTQYIFSFKVFQWTAKEWEKSNIFVNYNLFALTISSVEYCHFALVSSSGGLVLNTLLQVYLSV